MKMNKLMGVMAEKGYTQRMIAQELGMSKNTVNAKINGSSCFDTAEVIKLCGILGITDPKQKEEIFLQ